jgi:hypothetical protein
MFARTATVKAIRRMLKPHPPRVRVTLFSARLGSRTHSNYRRHYSRPHGRVQASMQYIPEFFSLSKCYLSEMNCFRERLKTSTFCKERLKTSTFWRAYADGARLSRSRG